MSFFHATDSVLYGEYLRKAVLFRSGSGNEVETNRRKVKGTFCACCIMRPMVHHIEKYSSEQLFDENDMTFLNGAGK